jgi:hypothetical protein
MEKKGATMLIAGIIFIIVFGFYIFLYRREKGSDDLDLNKNNFNRMIEKYKSSSKKS